MALTGINSAGISAWCSELIINEESETYFLSVAGYQSAVKGSVIETFGFLNLHNAPYYNNRTSDLFKKLFGKSEDTGNPYELMRDAGKTTRNYILENQSIIADLKDIFVELIELSPIESNVPMEGLRSSRAEKKANQLPDNRIDTRLMNEMENLAQGYMKSLDDKDAALCVLHLLIDAELYRQKVKKETEILVKPKAEKKPKDGMDGETMITGEKIYLPAGLIEPGERALAYLRVGLNVLFAGVPGTGKTTLAQFVAYSWNNQLDNLAEEMRLEAAPLTTVGNSAWSPFHTIGGLFPSPDGSFIPKPGIFIDPDRSVDDNWYLRPEAIVLDEMNRADLDRCIGELYPLLSRSVNVVYPAGIPGIKTIISDPNFRVVATINDATLDDIVFPISEGLSRRFQRIELPGASDEDVIAFLDLEQDTVSADKSHAVKEIINQLFSSSGEKNLLIKNDETDRLPFGAGYFNLLYTWVHGKLNLSETFREKEIIEQAFDILFSCLSTTIKVKSFDEVFKLMRRQI